MQECIFFDADQMIQERRGIVAPLGMQNSDEVFAFYCAALSFPEYFGWNWDAFDECIHDLYWIDGATIHIVHPDVPLKNDLDKRTIMLSSIHEMKFYSRTKDKLAKTSAVVLLVIAFFAVYLTIIGSGGRWVLDKIGFYNIVETTAASTEATTAASETTAAAETTAASETTAATESSAG